MPPHRSDWIGVDLDRTLAVRNSGDPLSEIGPPIHEMVNRVKHWLRENKNVKILTARVNPMHADAEDQRRLVQAWCVARIGVQLEVTCMKDHRMVELWDDLAVRVEENTGRQLAITDQYALPDMFTALSDEQRVHLLSLCCSKCGTTKLPCLKHIE